MVPWARQALRPIIFVDDWLLVLIFDASGQFTVRLEHEPLHKYIVEARHAVKPRQHATLLFFSELLAQLHADGKLDG